jgi:zinc protease
MKKIIFICFIALLNTLNAQDSINLKENLPLNPDVRYGKLSNGITYYILHNEEPKNRASYYIVQNVGAILENDNQNGLAHFLEHMSFNGTENFPQKGILNYLESYGVAFGRNINAYTNVDETVYNLSGVPVNNNNLIDSTLLILHDWCNYLLLTDEEIDAERGVIREEWRTRHSGRMRIYLESNKYLFEGSKYAERDVIGSLDVINNFKYDVIRDFYHDYYRTDLQAIVVVGDINTDSIENKIKRIFSPIPAVENPKERKYYSVPDNKEPIVGVVTDAEVNAIRFNLYFKHKATPFAKKNMKYYRDGLLQTLYSRMINERYSELIQTGKPPFINAYAAYYNRVRLMDVYNISSTLKEDNILDGIRATLTENERVLRYGFTSSELNRAKTDIISSLEKLLKEKDKQNSDNLARELNSNYLTNEPVLNIEYEYNLIKELFKNIQVDEINSLAHKWNTKNNMVVILSGPTKDSLIFPTKKQLLSVIAEVKKDSTIKAYTDNVSDKPLVETKPISGKIIKEKNLSEFNAVEWTLSNGAKVVIQNTNFKKDEINIKVLSNGGSSLYPVKDLPSILMLSQFMNSFGVGSFSNTELKKTLTGKIVSISPYINTLYQGFNGSSSVKDFETLLQLLYLQFEKPRFDQDAFNALKERYTAYVKNIDADINKAFKDTINLTVTDYNKRTILFNSEMIKNIDFETIKRVYNECFSYANNYTFIFNGNIDPDKAKELIELYIGSIKSNNKNINWVDNNIDYPKNDVYKKFSKDMKTPKTTIYINMHGNKIKYNAENRIYMNIISELLDKKFTEIIREKEGGTYGVGVNASVTHYPKESYKLSIYFDTDPDKADKLKEIVYQEVEKLYKTGIDKTDLDEAKKNMLKVREENLRKNGYWINAILHYYKHNEITITKSSFEDIINDVTDEKIRKFAEKYFTKTGVIEVVMTPANN